MNASVRERVETFCARYGLRLPILLAPMAGACPVGLSVAVGNAGGMGALGALMSTPGEIESWLREYRAATDAPVQANIWIPDPPPRRDEQAERAMREFLASWGPPVDAAAGDAKPYDFDEQCEALIAARPQVASSIMGLFPAAYVARLRDAGIAWFATATTLEEALAAEAAGADAIIAQSFEAGGHRGAFRAADAEHQSVGLFALLPRLVDKVKVPVIASGGISDGRGIAAALVLGASAVQVGTGFLRCPEAGIAPAWAQALADAEPEDTWPTRAFSGRLGRSLATDYVRAVAEPGAPTPVAYPVQRGLTAAMRKQGRDLARIQAWAGQSAWLAPAEPAGKCVQAWWEQASGLI